MSGGGPLPGTRVQITKRNDGGAVLRCVRPDGSVTWQKQEGKQAAFFPLHDLTHYAVESALGSREGFFGLIASGWDIEDTEGKGVRGALPSGAVAVEHVVGLLDAERASGEMMSAADFIAAIAVAYRQHRVAEDVPRLPLDDDVLGRIRAKRAELFSRWRALAPGDTLELVYPAARP